MRGVVFRRAAGQDLKVVLELLEHLGYPQNPERLGQVFDRALKEACLDIVLAVRDRRCLGLMTLRSRMSLRLAGPLLSIEELVVAPEARGRSLGALLIGWAKDQARACGAVRLEVQTSTSRQSYRRDFYLKNGFRPAASRLFNWEPQSGSECGGAAGRPEAS